MSQCRGEDVTAGTEDSLASSGRRSRNGGVGTGSLSPVCRRVLRWTLAFPCPGVPCGVTISTDETEQDVGCFHQSSRTCWVPGAASLGPQGLCTPGQQASPPPALRGGRAIKRDRGSCSLPRPGASTFCDNCEPPGGQASREWHFISTDVV